MAFSQSSRELSLDSKNRLLAKCRKLDRTENNSSISLDGCLGNRDGCFDTKGQFFSRSAREVKLSGPILSAQLRRVDGGWNHDAINLDAFISNADGGLIPMKNYDANELRPIQKQADLSTTEGLKCSLCGDFPSPHTSDLSISVKELASPRRRSGCPTCSILEHAMETLAPASPNYELAAASCRGKKSASSKDHLIELEFEYPSTGGPGSGEPYNRRYVMHSSFGGNNESSNFRDVPRAGLTIGDSTSPKAIELAQTWINTCAKQHSKCNHGTKMLLGRTREGKQPLPARILDIGANDSDAIKLLITNGAKGAYACLSHCWGKTKSIVLNQGNEHTLTKDIPWKGLPKTYTDAITFCRRLGIRYLWIDALCIIQDDAQDWRQESVKMGSYYGNCYACLAATTSANHDDGCAISSPPLKYAGAGLDGLPYCIYIRPESAHIAKQRDHKHAEYFPLLTRAWAYQERRLSPRVLHFCGVEMFFECAEMTACECEQSSKPLENDSWTKAWEAHYVTHHDLSDIKDERTRVAHEWHSFVRAYSRLSLTFPSDRLPALSGLAKAMRERREQNKIPTGRYLAGLWEGTLFNDMAWSVGKELARWRKAGNATQPGRGASTVQAASKPRLEEYVAPSWSWASVQDPVEYAPFGYSTYFPEILETQTELKDKDPTGQVTGGSLVLRGRLLKSRWGRTTMGFAPGYFSLFDAHGTRPTFLGMASDQGMKWFPDYDIDAPSRHKVAANEHLYLLPLVSRPIVGRGKEAEFRFRLYPGKTVVETVYLVLKRASNAAVTVFERVGWTEYTGSSDVPDLGEATYMKFMLV